MGKQNTSTPRTANLKKYAHRPSSRPRSITSSKEGSHAQTHYGTDKEITVQMTEYGMRRVKQDDFNYGMHD